MENKTDHLRRMRARRKYWRVTPNGERITINPKGENVMSKPKLQARWAAAINKAIDARDAAGREMLATLKLHIEEINHGGRFIGYDYQDRMRAAIAQAEAAGIK